jgi:fumarate hydratase class I
MDHWLPALGARGASLVSIAKGERGDAARRACAEFGAVYLATAGGVAALFGRDHVRSSRIVAYPELGMEAVRLVELVDLPAIVSVDARGGDALAANRR